MNSQPDLGSADVRPLALPGRTFVVIGVALALLLGLTSGTGLLEGLPYGVVGGFLAIRRPRNSIGWLLLLGSWAFAVTSFNVPASAPTRFVNALYPRESLRRRRSPSRSSSANTSTSFDGSIPKLVAARVTISLRSTREMCDRSARPVST